MPLTKKGRTILTHMRQTYGSDKKAKHVFYAMEHAGKLPKGSVLTGRKQKARS